MKDETGQFTLLARRKVERKGFRKVPSKRIVEGATDAWGNEGLLPRILHAGNGVRRLSLASPLVPVRWSPYSGWTLWRGETLILLTGIEPRKSIPLCISFATCWIMSFPLQWILSACRHWCRIPNVQMLLRVGVQVQKVTFWKMFTSAPRNFDQFMWRYKNTRNPPFLRFQLNKPLQQMQAYLTVHQRWTHHYKVGCLIGPCESMTTVWVAWTGFETKRERVLTAADFK